MSRRPFRFGKRFAGTGIGQTQTLSQLYGLNYTARKRSGHYKEVEERLKEQAKAGDEQALYRLKKLRLARPKGTSKREITTVRPKFLDNTILEDMLDARIEARQARPRRHS